MSRSYESQHSHDVSQQIMQNENSSHDAHFIYQLHQKYGIPIAQLRNIYADTKNIRPTFCEENDLDYGDKLILNHNILKEMVYMLDNKEKMLRNHSITREKTNQSQTINTHRIRLDQKLQEVKYRLEELIHFIGQEKQQDNIKPIEIKKIVNLSDIKQGSYVESSLQYSKEYEQESKEKSGIVIDLEKLEKAKEVTSQFLLGNNLQESQRVHEKQMLMKSSLDRISEVQSGETIEKQEERYRSSKGINKNQQSKESISFSNEHILSQTQQLDETGRIILSTINKKTTKVSILNDKDNPGSKMNVSAANIEETRDQVKKSRFWKNKNGRLGDLPLTTTVSNEMIESARGLQNVQRSHFKMGELNRGYTFKSLDNLDKHEKQAYKSPTSTVKAVRHQLTNTQKPQFIRYSQSKGSEASSSNNFNSSLFHNKDSDTYINKWSLSNIKQSKILKQFPSKTLIEQDPSLPLRQTAHFIEPKVNNSMESSYGRPISVVPYANNRENSVNLYKNSLIPSIPKTYSSITTLPPKPNSNLMPILKSQRLMSHPNLSAPSIQNSIYIPASQDRIRSLAKDVIMQRIVRKPEKQVIDLLGNKQIFRQSRISTSPKLKKKGIQLTNQTFYNNTQS